MAEEHSAERDSSPEEDMAAGGDRHLAASVEEAEPYRASVGRHILDAEGPYAHVSGRLGGSRLTSTYRIVVRRRISTVLGWPRLRRRIWMRCSWIRILALTGRVWRRIWAALVSDRRSRRRLCRVVATLGWVIRRRILRPMRVPRIGHLRHVQRRWWVIQVSKGG